MKRVFSYLILLLTLALSCQREEIFAPTQTEGEVSLHLHFDVSDMTSVSTKAVDPDGIGIQNMVLYCFDEYGLFITTVTMIGEDYTPDQENPSLSGSFRVSVPSHTHIVHVVGNQNLYSFNEGLYRNKSEYEVMSALEASGGRMVYWARKSMDELLASQDGQEKIKLLRNQAKVTVEVGNSVPFEVEGFIVTNSSAFGTVAPYKKSSHEFVAPSLTDPFVTIPEDKLKLGDFQDVRGTLEEYVFETENTIDNPVNVIVKGSYNGGPSLYYRIILMDDDGSQLMLLRNHHYRVNIMDQLSYGQTTFAEALTAPATNNVWITVADHVPQIHGIDYILSVDHTNVVIDESQFVSPNIYQLYYTISRVDGKALTASDQAQVSWMDGNNVAYNAFEHQFNTSTGRGALTITLHNLGNYDKRMGTLLVEIGGLYRKIKVTTIRRQQFTPAWASTQVYGYETGEHLTLMFTIPDNCPEELFPLEVLISTNVLDVRHEAGQELPVRLELDSQDYYYGEPNDWGYKYVYTVDSPGSKCLYLKNILVQNGGSSIIRAEAQHFDMLEHNFTFAEESVNRAIIIHGLHSYSATQPADDPIFYYYVPQKINAHLEISTHVGVLYDSENADTDGTIQGGGTTKYVDYSPLGEQDEFLFYSKYLSHDEEPHECDFNFYPIQEANWGVEGRVYGFNKNGDYTHENYGMAFHMHTNSSRSEELVRVASNPLGAPSVSGNGVCAGMQYRCVIFELKNYHPFSFAAQIDYAAQGMTGSVASDGGPEQNDVLSWSYVPGQPVNLGFDITSFKGVDEKSVDPFGVPFEIYIDAPMLELDNVPSALAGKIKKSPTVPGRFVYTVDADREVERASGSAEAYLKDATGANQSGERKIIPFRVKDIVSAGEISISAQDEVAVFHTKKFKVINESIRGRLKYQNGTLKDVPAEAFVVLEATKNYNRIGTITMGAIDGEGQNMDIRLRSEYSYNWYNDPVKIQFARTDGGEVILYEKTFASLDALYAACSAPIILTSLRGY